MGLIARGGGEEDDSEQISISGFDGLDVGGTPAETEYVLDEWSPQDRSLLRERLETVGVPHRWEGATLIVAAADEAWAERVMDQVEADLDDLRAEQSMGTVGYDLSAWDDDSCVALMDALTADGIPYQIEADELFVDSEDEARTDEIVAGIADPDAELPAPVATEDVMSDLFVMADRVLHDPDDPGTRRELAAAVTVAMGTDAPYGMDAGWWTKVLHQAEALVSVAEAVPLDEDVLRASATELRDALRPFV